MGTRVRSCIRVRSRAGADDALMRGMCASATRCLRNAIHGTRTGMVYRYMMHACNLYPCASSYTDERIAGVGPPHTHARTCCVRVRARVRVRLGAHASAPKHASAFCRRGPRLARCAGVHQRVGVQRGHRRVEHRVSHRLELCMRRLLGLAARPAGGTRSAGRRCGAGRLCAAATADARARVCAQTCGCAHAWLSGV